MTGDNSDTTLTLSVAPVSENNVQVYFDGVYQSKANYSISGTTLTFSTAPATGVAVEAITHTQTSINVPTSNSVGITQLNVADGTNGQVLTTDGAGTLSFADSAGGVDGIVSNADATAITIDSSENVGIGITNPSTRTHIYSSASSTPLIVESTSNTYVGIKNTTQTAYIGAVTSNMIFENNGAERARIDSAGNLLLGTTSHSTGAFGAATGINVKKPRPQVLLQDSTNNTDAYFGLVTGSVRLSTQDALDIQFHTNDVERMRINSSGYTKYTTVGAYVNTSGTYHETIGSHASIAYYMYNTNSGGDVLFLNCNNENSSNFFLAGYSDNAGRHNIYIYSNGNVVNRNNSYGSLSDQKLKQDIEDANSQWEDIKAIQFRKYRWKQDVASNADAPYQLGVIAQELESAGMHGLVEETDDKEFYDEVVLDENGNPVLDENGNNVTQREERLTGESTKSVKYSILTLKALKALQEAMERIETLEARITTLENA